MKITNLEALTFVQTAGVLKESGKLGFAIAKNMRKLADELVEYDQKRGEIIQKYGIPEGDNRYRFTEENAKKFYEEMEEYDAMEFEFQPTTVSEEVFCSGGLTSDQMYALMWMVEN